MNDKPYVVDRGEMVLQTGLVGSGSSVPGSSGQVDVRSATAMNQSQMRQQPLTMMNQGTGGSLTLSNPRKRKLTLTEVAQLRRKVSENEGVKILKTASRYAERCGIRCYLGGGGSPAEYPMWRNRLPRIPLVSHLVANRLDPENPTEDLYSLLRSNTTSLMRSSSSSAQHDPSSTSASNYSTSHSSRVGIGQTSQASGPSLPTSPDKHASRPPQRLPVSPYKLSPIKHEASGDLSPNQEHIVERAKQEAYVMQRVAELQRDGLWSEKRVPKLQELPRPKSHWDYVLEEMAWMAADFAQERMWKKAAAKKCATMVQKYFRDKESSARREAKLKEDESRRIAGVMAREIKLFWFEISRLVGYKQKLLQEEIIRQTLNSHLNQSCLGFEAIKDNFRWEDTESVKDSVENEIELLKNESVLPLNEVIGDYLEVRDRLVSSETDADETDESDSMEVSDSEPNEDVSVESDDRSTDIDTSSSSEDDSYEEESEEDSLKDANKLKTVEEIIKVAENLKPSSVTCSYEIKEPILLRKKLREYQLIGYNWLVSLYDKELNGILADESSLGKTVEVIALLAHLAGNRANWGPFLVVVPTSQLLKWENEFKRWCPGFKILSYCGSVKERRSKRIGWTRPHAFNVCITSYSLLIQDIFSFRKKKWQYLILDDAQSIVNFDSPRWSSFQNIRAKRKLVLTSGPLNESQFRSFSEFLISGDIKESGDQCNLLRSLCLGRIKSQVESQLPKTNEQIVKCRLSSHQRYCYDDFMNSSDNLSKLKSGSVVDVLNVAVELQKICNHPDLFDSLPVESSFRMEGLVYEIPSLVSTVLDYNPFKNVDLSNSSLNLIGLENWLSAFVAHRSRRYQTPKKLIEEIDSVVTPEECPRKLGGIKISVKKNPSTGSVSLKSSIRPALVQIGSGANSHKLSPTKIGTSPIVKAAVIQQNSMPQGVTLRLTNPIGPIQNYLQIVGQQGKVTQTARLAHIVNTPAGKQILISPHQLLSSQPSTVVTSGGQRLTVVSKQGVTPASLRPLLRLPPLAVSSGSNILLGSANIDNSTVVDNTVTLKTDLFDANKVLNDSSKEVSDVQSKTVLFENNSSNGNQLFDKDVNNDTLEKRKVKLNLLCCMNDQRCGKLPVYGTDVISRLTVDNKFKQTRWLWTGTALCKNSKINESSENKHLSNCIKNPLGRMVSMNDVLSRYLLCISPVCSSGVQLNVTKGAPWKSFEINRVEGSLKEFMLPTTNLLQPLNLAMHFKFPDRQWIQYDCGKLMALGALLRRLKAKRHRVIIFTQMTRMLDILENFLKFHGFIYLRLDGSTKVEQRQILLERFNNDSRLFCFILSTRSSGVTLDLSGADAIIHYDSDWNPLVDAMVSRQCNVLCSAKEVNVYRLVSEETVEENYLNCYIRFVRDLEIENEASGQSYFKTSTIEDLFGVDLSCGRFRRRISHEDQTRERRCSLLEKDSKYLALNNALAEVENAFDSLATKIVTEEKKSSLIELDVEPETEDEYDDPVERQQSETEAELEALERELTGVERYAVKFIEESEVVDEELSSENHWELIKKEWEFDRCQSDRELLRMKRKNSFSDDEELTYSGVDSRCSDWATKFGLSMPLWAPPTPPQDDNDMYIDEALCLLYEPTLIPEAQLPPAYTKKDRKRSRMEINLISNRLQSNKIRQKEETLVHAPRSLFDRPSPALLKMRQELRLQRYRGLMRPSVQNILKPPLPVKPLPEPDHVPDWLIHEDWMILQAVQHVQEMTVNLVVLSPGHTPNWDLVADMVNMSSRTYRSPKQCRNRYESVIIPREEGKPVPDSPKKQKKSKLLYKPPQLKSGRPLRTSQLFQQDNNSSMTQVMNCRYDAVRSVSNRRAPTVKPLHVDPTMKNNPRHADTLARSQIDYDRPLTPVEVAAKRAERIAREKLLNSAPIHVKSITDQAHLTALCQQQLQKLNASSGSAGASPRQLATLTVQEMVATVGGNRTVVSTSGIPVSRAVSGAVSSNEVKSTTVSIASPSSAGGTQSPSPTSSSPVASPLSGKAQATKTISAAQLAIYRQQQQHQTLLRQKQLKLLKAQQQVGSSGGVAAGSSTPPKVSIAVTPPQSPAGGSLTGSTVTTVPRMQQVVVKSGRAVTESEMVALLKRQQAAKVSGSTSQSPATLTTAQILTSIQVKTTQGETTTVLPQQVKPITLQHHQLLAAAAAAHQRSNSAGNKIGGQQKVAQFAQVPGKAVAGGTQLIVQSGHKTLPTTVTVQQIQQVMKQVRPGHVVVTGPGRTATIPGTVSLEGRQVLAGTLKTSQQAILAQVSGVSSSGRTTTPIVSAPLITIPPTAAPQQSDASQPH